ncbi:uncharacterized protein LOC132039144 [Lycium ferocissimum]|uniref:uncharacterized protein LOC132039144 n=1 Tax=Lycium ferocissimum TaxID=112874 RepID=UPI00281539BC|nr:uncharacterized protein LOC132039144 [Lycium ferocissimum]
MVSDRQERLGAWRSLFQRLSIIQEGDRVLPDEEAMLPEDAVRVEDAVLLLEDLVVEDTVCHSRPVVATLGLTYVYAALLLAEIPGSSSQPSQNAYMEERDNVDWAALRASLADERPVRNLEGARILDFDEFLIPDSAPAGPPEPPTQAFSHGPAEPAVSAHVTIEPQDSAPVGPQELPIQEHSHQPAEAEVSSHETTEALRLAIADSMITVSDYGTHANNWLYTDGDFCDNNA